LPKVVWEICFQFAQQHIHGEDLPNRVFEAQLLVTMAFWIPDGPHHAAKQIRPCLPLAGSLAVRFPRFTGKYREDKSAEDCTTSDEIVEMYRAQLKKIAESPSAEAA